MRLLLLISTVAHFSAVFSYAHYANSDLSKHLQRRKGPDPNKPVTSGSDGSADGVLIGDLVNQVTTPVGFLVRDILLSDAEGESDEIGVRPPSLESCGTSSDVCCPWYYVSDFLTKEFVDEDGLCNDLARAAIRLGFHDAGTWSASLAANGTAFDFGGADGSFSLFGEIARGENKGLEEIDELASYIWGPDGPFGAYELGMADIIQYMATHATVSCPLGPRVRTFIGRDDATQQAPEGLLPGVNSDAETLIQLFMDKTIAPHELTALLGAHSTSKQFHQKPEEANMPQDTTPGVWDVLYYNETIQANGPAGVAKFHSDVVLAQDPRINDEWMQFIDDQHHWNEDFARAYVRLSLLGVNKINQLTECTKTLPKALKEVPPKRNITSSSTSSMMSSTTSSSIASSSESSSSSIWTSSDSSSIYSSWSVSANATSTPYYNATATSYYNESYPQTVSPTISSYSSESLSSASLSESSYSSDSSYSSSVTSSSSSGAVSPIVTSTTSSVISSESYSSTSSYYSESSYSVDSSVSSSSAYTSSSVVNNPVLTSTTSSTISSEVYAPSSTSSSEPYSSKASSGSENYSSTVSSLSAGPIVESSSRSTYSSKSSGAAVSPVLTSTSSAYSTYTTSSKKFHPLSSSHTSSHIYSSSSTSSAKASPVWPPKYYQSSSHSGSSLGNPPVKSKTSASYSSSTPARGVVTATVITTSYVDICSTGLTVVSLTYTTNVASKATTSAVPYGWTTTVTVCKHCGPKPTTLTLTKPVQGFYQEKHPSSSLTTETIFSTRLHTITDAGGRRTVLTSSIPVSTMIYPVPVKDTPFSLAFGEKSKQDGGHGNSGPGSAGSGESGSSNSGPGSSNSGSGESGSGDSGSGSSNSGPGKAGGGSEDGHSASSASSPVKPTVTASTSSSPGAGGTGSKTQGAPVNQFTGGASKQVIGSGVLISVLISLMLLL